MMSNQYVGEVVLPCEGEGPRTYRVALDVASGALLSVQIKTGQAWRPLSAGFQEVLQDALINVYDALRNPVGAGLTPATPLDILMTGNSTMYTWARRRGLFDSWLPVTPDDRMRLALTFWDELTAHDLLPEGVFERFGERTLTDLFHLYHAVVEGCPMEWRPEESRVLEVIKGLPNAQCWAAMLMPLSDFGPALRPVAVPAPRMLSRSETELESSVATLLRGVDEIRRSVEGHEFDRACIQMRDSIHLATKTNQLANSMADALNL